VEPTAPVGARQIAAWAHTKLGGESQKTSEVSTSPFSGSKLLQTDGFGRARHRVNLRGLLLPQFVDAPFAAFSLLLEDLFSMVVLYTRRGGSRWPFGGATVGVAIQLLVAAVGLASLLHTVAGAFEWLRWAGAAYLVYLGINSGKVPIQDEGGDCG
jgi:hypothetical protein